MPPIGPSKVSSEIFCLKKLKWFTNVSCERPESMFSIFKDTHTSTAAVSAAAVAQEPQIVRVPIGAAMFQ